MKELVIVTVVALTLVISCGYFARYFPRLSTLLGVGLLLVPVALWFLSWDDSATSPRYRSEGSMGGLFLLFVEMVLGAFSVVCGLVVLVVGAIARKRLDTSGSGL